MGRWKNMMMGGSSPSANPTYPYFVFDDQKYYLRYNGDASLTPSFCTMSELPFLTLNHFPAFASDLEQLLKKAWEHSDRMAASVQDYINENIAPRAKMLWAIKQSFADNRMVRLENTAVLEAELATNLYVCDQPEQFLDIMRAFAVDHPNQRAFAAILEDNMKIIHSPQADFFAKREVDLWLEQQGFPHAHATGSGQRLFSDYDTKDLGDSLRQSLSAKLKNMDGLIKDIKTLAEKNHIEIMPSEKNEALAEELMRLPRQCKNPDISVILDFALQDNNFQIHFSSGHTLANAKRPYGGLFGSASYDSSTKRVRLPKNEPPSGPISREAMLGYRLEGEFAVINDLIKEENPSYDRNARWREELFHRSMDRLFKNGGLPFKDDATKQQYLAALTYDLEHGQMIESIRSYVALPTASGKDLLAYITPDSPKFDPQRSYRA